jgi:hypothetical protein
LFVDTCKELKTIDRNKVRDYYKLFGNNFGIDDDFLSSALRRREDLLVEAVPQTRVPQRVHAGSQELLIAIEIQSLSKEKRCRR